MDKKNNQNTIDIVYTWVNNKDICWLNKKNEAFKEYKNTIITNGISKGRFENHDELKYSLRSVEMYMPWVRNIYIVTDNQIPEWLSLKDKRIKIIDHKEIFPEYIKKPIFNPLLIEWFLHKIPGLSDKYIYFNDDFIINKPVKENDFFNNEKPWFYTTKPTKDKIKIPLKISDSIFETKNVSKIESFFNKRNLNEPYFYQNTIDLFSLENKNFNDRFYLKHIPYSFIKSDIEKIFNKYEIFIKQMASNQFRNKNDIQISLIYLLNNYQPSMLITDNNSLFEYALGVENYKQKMEEVINIFNPKFKFISVSQGDTSNENYIRLLIETLEIRFPNPSNFEIKQKNNYKIFYKSFINYFKKINVILDKNEEKLLNKEKVINEKEVELHKIYSGEIWKTVSFIFSIKSKIIRKINFFIEKNKTINISIKKSKKDNNYPETNNKKLKTLYKFSIYDVKNSINVITPTFFDFDGDNYYCGGAERYLTDLFEIAKKNKVKFNIYQYGNYQWIRKYNDISVISLSNDSTAKDGSIENQRKFSEYFYKKVTLKSILNIYSPFFITHGYTAKPSIGISHGIAWDNPKNTSLKDTSNSLIEILKSCKDHSSLVSVDTNTPKWIQTFDYESSLKMEYVPNYVDIKKFFPRNNFLERRKKIKILFPRRFYKPRGLYLVLGIVDSIIKNDKNVEFHFVGRGFIEDTKEIENKIRKYPNNIKMYSKEPDEMPEVYRDADISLIPTLYSEGTSLSLLEAAASGNAIIATRIGGLTDLVVNGLNGYLIEPNEKDLERKILELIKNKDILNELKKKSVESSVYFSKDKWNKKWEEILKQYIKTNEKYQYEKIVFFKKSPLFSKNKFKYLLKLLKNNCIVYIYNNDIVFNKKYSFERLQFVDKLPKYTKVDLEIE